MTMPLPQERSYTYADLLSWDGDNTRYELYHGQLTALAAPSDVHQRIFRSIFTQLANYLDGKRCEVFSAPFDVRLFEKEGDQPQNVDTVVQPDILVVCDPRKIDHRGVRGAPDMVIEILSDSTRRTDRLMKFNLYQRSGVREYWIVDPATRTASVYTLEEGAYHAADIYNADASVPVGILGGCRIDMTMVFPASR